MHSGNVIIEDVRGKFLASINLNTKNAPLLPDLIKEILSNL